MAISIETEQDVRHASETVHEAILYFLINELGGMCWRLNHDLADRRILDPDGGVATEIDRLRLFTGILAEKSSRFGVLGNTFPNDSYWRWFRWWDAWCKALSDAEFREMDKDLSEEKNLDKWRPPGDWKSEEELAVLTEGE